MHLLKIAGGAALLLLTVTGLQAQQTGQPASNVLSSEDLYGNPTFVGGVTNGGPHSHSIW